MNLFGGKLSPHLPLYSISVETFFSLNKYFVLTHNPIHQSKHQAGRNICNSYHKELVSPIFKLFPNADKNKRPVTKQKN